MDALRKKNNSVTEYLNKSGLQREQTRGGIKGQLAKENIQGLPWWASGYDSMLPMQEVWV